MKNISATETMVHVLKLEQSVAENVYFIVEPYMHFIAVVYIP